MFSQSIYMVTYCVLLLPLKLHPLKVALICLNSPTSPLHLSQWFDTLPKSTYVQDLGAVEMHNNTGDCADASRPFRFSRLSAEKRPVCRPVQLPALFHLSERQVQVQRVPGRHRLGPPHWRLQLALQYRLSRVRWLSGGLPRGYRKVLIITRKLLIGVTSWFQQLTALVLKRQGFHFEPELWPTYRVSEENCLEWVNLHRQCSHIPTRFQ